MWHENEARMGLDDRRSEPRGATVFRPVLIETGGAANLCLVRNLSPSGLRGKVYTGFRPAEAVSVQFAPGDTVQGSVIWYHDEHIGIQFAEAVDVAQVLASAAKKEMDGKLSRPFRVPINTRCELVVDGRTICGDALDISQRGLKVLTSYVRCGEEVVVQLRGLDERKAVVRWIHSGMAGLNFVRALSFDELAQWVVELTGNEACRSPVAMTAGRTGHPQQKAS